MTASTPAQSHGDARAEAASELRTLESARPVFFEEAPSAFAAAGWASRVWLSGCGGSAVQADLPSGKVSGGRAHARGGRGRVGAAQPLSDQRSTDGRAAAEIQPAAALLKLTKGLCPARPALGRGGGDGCLDYRASPHTQKHHALAIEEHQLFAPHNPLPRIRPHARPAGRGSASEGKPASKPMQPAHAAVSPRPSRDRA